MKPLYSNDPTSLRFTGFASSYDKFRPNPPDDLFDLILKLSNKRKPELIVDLGAGTGISTRPWAQYANKVIGIDPSEDMLTVAKTHTKNAAVEYQLGYGHNTNLSSNCADIVTCSSSIHWMPPEPTIKELSRILKTNGLFVTYGHYYPVVAESYNLTKAYERWRKNLDHLEFNLLKQAAKKWKLDDIRNVFKKSNIFKYTRQMYLHSKLYWDEEQFKGFLMAHAGVHYLNQKRKTNTELGLDDIFLLTEEVFGNNKLTIIFTYSVYFAIL